ncbi:MAG: tetratricopeptide repeat protein [Acidobacteriia bacterium]|nr:tetratricopeptide repeat protein [Terriglobia bacterium]
MPIRVRESFRSWRAVPALLTLASAFSFAGARAQSIDIGGDKQNSVPSDVVINVMIDQIQNHAPAGLMVRLEAPGDNSLQGGQQTDSSGRVVFRIVAGVYQVGITGAGIEPYEGTIQIMHTQARDTENIIVRSKSTGASGAPSGPDPVSASKFKVPEKAAKEFQAGSKAMEQKDYGEAKRRFTNATALYSDYAAAYNGIGAAQMAGGDTAGARASFEKAVQIDDSFAEAYRNLARLALADHKFEEVENLLTKSLQGEPLNAWALTYAAYAELQTQKFELAITHARAAHGVAHPGLASVHIVAAHALEATNRPDEALKEYKLYMEEDPNGRDAPRAKQAIASLESPQAN